MQWEIILAVLLAIGIALVIKEFLNKNSAHRDDKE
jgi:hypothetical protein